jgi:hypothetical protein
MKVVPNVGDEQVNVSPTEAARARDAKVRRAISFDGQPQGSFEMGRLDLRAPTSRIRSREMASHVSKAGRRMGRREKAGSRGSLVALYLVELQ